MIFRRSVVSELANSAGGIFTVLFSIVITVGLVRILGRAAGGRADPGTVFELMAYTGLSYLPPLLTLSLFIAVLMVLIRCWQDNEMVVWFSSGGISLLAWIRPVLRFALPVVAVIAVLSTSVTPWANSQIDRSTDEYKQRDDVTKIAPGRFIETMGGRRVFFIEDVDKEGTHVKGVFMSEKDGKKEVVLQAESGEIVFNDKGDRYIVLHHGRHYQTSTSGNEDWRVIDFDTYEILLEVKAEQIYARQEAEMLPWSELVNSNNVVYQAQMMWRLCWPLAALNLVLLAIPLSYTNPRAGRSLNLVIAVLIFILYLNGMTMASTWVKAEKLHWLVALVLLNGGVLAFTVMLFVRRVWLQRWIPESISALPYRLLSRGKQR